MDFGFSDPKLMLAGLDEVSSWDAVIGAEPARAEAIAFTAAYCEIECTYLVPAGSAISSCTASPRTTSTRTSPGSRPCFDSQASGNPS